MTLFQFHYRVESTRNPHRDYRSPGYCFVTICTKNRVPHFGTITNGQINLSPIGKIAESEILKTAQIRPDIEITEWVIMPNHMHMVIRLLPEKVARRPHEFNHFGPQSRKLPAVVRGIKSAVKRRANIHGLAFHWQPGYHDHMVRDEDELHRICWYVRKNPAVWKSDLFFREIA